MDFYKIKSKVNTKTGVVEIWPDFSVGNVKDIMIRGKSFYAIWDEERQIWSTDEYDVQRIIDKDLAAARDKLVGEDEGSASVRWMRDMSSGSWMQYRKFVQNVSDKWHTLDDNLTFANTKVSRIDYVSKRLPYPLEEGPCPAWDEIVGTLYLPEERQKLEWAIGAVVAGDAKRIQKFFVLFGASGKGKSTVINIIQKLFEGYYTVIESKSLGNGSNSFATEMFRGNPLVAIEHDGDLSRIEDNTKLNSIVGHEAMMINEKFKSGYSIRPSAAIFIGTNKPVKITDAKSGIIRRLISIQPSGITIPVERYWTLMAQVDFELGAIAHHCLSVYRQLGENYYNNYIPLDMILQTNVFFNFIEAHYYTFLQSDEVTLQRAWEMYKTYCEEALIDHRLPKYKFRDELRNYFKEFKDRHHTSDDQTVRSLYIGFRKDLFESKPGEEQNKVLKVTLVLDQKVSEIDTLYSEMPAQYADEDSGIPKHKWANVQTTLKDLDTAKTHYVKLPPNHIVIDFDLKNENGEKASDLNLIEASKWPPTYSEYSKSGGGIHLHYIYDGDVSRLEKVYSPGIEIKSFPGDSALRRKLTWCNNLPIVHLNSGLPLKGEKMINPEVVKSEKGLRDLITRNLNKEIHGFTRPSIDFIKKILDDAYSSGMEYDLTPMKPKVLAFAIGSTNQAEHCVTTVAQMKFKSEDKEIEEPKQESTKEIVFYDVEVFQNLVLVCWKYAGKDNKVVRMYNPKPEEIEKLFNFRLIGFNNRRYDNHILYAIYLGYSTTEIFKLSSRIINNNSTGYFREAYNLSYTDIYDFSSEKKSLKAWQLELGILHKELGIPWDLPVPEDQWDLVGEYCDNDVISSEAVFEYRKQDFIARQILADLTGMTVNDTTQALMAKLLFGNDTNPQSKFVYTHLDELFPGYTFDSGKSSYRGEDPGEGGYVYSEPGIYEDVALLDVASMHPASIINMNAFGPYTKRYEELLKARLYIKHKDYDSAKEVLGGVLAKYLDNPENAQALAYALKIALNIVYGLTSASFDNKFRDPRNVDNIVAKRGALFMIDLKHAVQEQGFTVAHIKTDSIKIPNATPEIIRFVHEFGKKYGYTFEHEATYSKFCLVNKAVYIAQYKDGKKAGQWTPTGAQFAHPYVFKTLFSKEDIQFPDLCEAKAVMSPSALYLDMNENLEEGEHNYHFVGKVGSFCPVVPGAGGGLLMREKDGKYFAATGTKGYRWLEAEVVKELDIVDKIDYTYFNELVSEAIKHISTFGDFDKFVSE